MWGGLLGPPLCRCRGRGGVGEPDSADVVVFLQLGTWFVFDSIPSPKSVFFLGDESLLTYTDFDCADEPTSTP